MTSQKGKREMMTAEKDIWWCTKWASTAGVMKVVGQPEGPDREGFLTVSKPPWHECRTVLVRVGRNVFREKEDAIADARRRIAKRLVSLERQVEDMRKLQASLGAR